MAYSNSDYRGKNRTEIDRMGGRIGRDGTVLDSWGNDTGNKLPSHAATSRPK